jgi:hypothetical protein
LSCLYRVDYNVFFGLFGYLLFLHKKKAAKNTLLPITYLTIIVDGIWIFWLGAIWGLSDVDNPLYHRLHGVKSLSMLITTINLHLKVLTIQMLLL